MDEFATGITLAEGDAKDRIILAVADYYKTRQNRTGRKKGYSQSASHERKRKPGQQNPCKDAQVSLFEAL